MPASKVNTRRFDPYRSYRFQVSKGDTVVAAFHQLALPHPSHAAGAVRGVVVRPASPTHVRLTLQRGITLSAAFEAWAQGDPDTVDEADANSVAKDLKIAVLDEQGQTAMTYHAHGAAVTEWRASPDLDANANAIAIAVVKMSCRTLIGPEAARDTSGRQVP